MPWKDNLTYLEHINNHPENRVISQEGPHRYVPHELALVPNQVQSVGHVVHKRGDTIGDDSFRGRKPQPQKSVNCFVLQLQHVSGNAFSKFAQTHPEDNHCWILFSSATGLQKLPSPVMLEWTLLLVLVSVILFTLQINKLRSNCLTQTLVYLSVYVSLNLLLKIFIQCSLCCESHLICERELNSSVWHQVVRLAEHTVSVASENCAGWSSANSVQEFLALQDA